MCKWILYLLIKRAVTVKRLNKRKTSELIVTKQTVSLVSEILSGCVRFILAIGLCIAGRDLAKSMRATSLVELSKSSEECKTMFQKLTNDITHVSQKLAASTQDISRVNGELSSATNALRFCKIVADDLKSEMESTYKQMKDAEGTNKVNSCICPLCCCCWW